MKIKSTRLHKGSATFFIIPFIVLFLAIVPFAKSDLQSSNLRPYDLDPNFSNKMGATKGVFRNKSLIGNDKFFTSLAVDRDGSLWATANVFIDWFDTVGFKNYLFSLDNNGKSRNLKEGSYRFSYGSEPQGASEQPVWAVKDTLITAENKILVLYEDALEIRRYQRGSDGISLDPSFGSDGVFKLNVQDFNNSETQRQRREVQGFNVRQLVDRITSIKMAIQHDGKIIVAGAGSSIAATPPYLPSEFRNYPWVVRLTQNGQLDSTFGDSRSPESSTVKKGVFIIPDQGGYSMESLALSIQDEIFIGGMFLDSSNHKNNPVIFKIDRNGMSFGKILIEKGPEFEQDYQSKVMDLGVQSDGKLLALIMYKLPPALKYRLMRFLSNGRPDPSFGNRLSYVDSDPSIQLVPSTDLKLLLQPDGKIWVGSSVAGLSQPNKQSSIALARYQSDGKIDQSFASASPKQSENKEASLVQEFPSHGYVVYTFKDQNPPRGVKNRNEIKSLVLQADGKILIGGILGGEVGVARIMGTDQTMKFPLFEGAVVKKAHEEDFVQVDGPSLSKLPKGQSIPIKITCKAIDSNGVESISKNCQYRLNGGSPQSTPGTFVKMGDQIAIAHKQDKFRTVITRIEVLSTVINPRNNEWGLSTSVKNNGGLFTFKTVMGDAPAQWITGEWSECNVSCGYDIELSGTQTRAVRCEASSKGSACTGIAPSPTQSCSVKCPPKPETALDTVEPTTQFPLHQISKMMLTMGSGPAQVTYKIFAETNPFGGVKYRIRNIPSNSSNSLVPEGWSDWKYDTQGEEGPCWRSLSFTPDGISVVKKDFCSCTTAPDCKSAWSPSTNATPLEGI